MSRWSVRAAVSAVAVAVLLAVIPFGDVAEALRRVSPWTWVGSLVIFFAGHYLNAVKLRWLIGPEAASLTACVQAQYAGLVANLGLPGLAGGDFVRAAYLVRTAGAGRVTLASVMDRLIDTVTLILLVAAALPIAGVPAAVADLLKHWWWIGVAAMGGAMLLAGLWLAAKQGILPAGLRRAGADMRTRRAAICGAVAISFTVQSAFVLTNAQLAREVGVTSSLATWFVAWPLSKLIAVLPISLGGIGVREAALVSLMAPYGAPREAVLASGILWQTVLAGSGLAGLVITQWRRHTLPAAPVVPGPGSGS